MPVLGVVIVIISNNSWTSGVYCVLFGEPWAASIPYEILESIADRHPTLPFLLHVYKPLDTCRA